MSASPEVNDLNNLSEKHSSQKILENQRHLMIVEDIQGSLIGVPMDSPPTLRRVPKSAFSPIPAIYLAEGNIQCVSALITVSENEPPFFLLNLDQVLQQGASLSRDTPKEIVLKRPARHGSERIARGHFERFVREH